MYKETIDRYFEETMSRYGLTREDVKEHLNSVSKKRMRECLIRRLAGKTLEEIGQEFDVTRTTISNEVMQALRKIKFIKTQNEVGIYKPTKVKKHLQCFINIYPAESMLKPRMFLSKAEADSGNDRLKSPKLRIACLEIDEEYEIYE